MKFKTQIVILVLVLLNSLVLNAQTTEHFNCGLHEDNQNQNMTLSTFSTPTFSGSVDPVYLESFPKITFNIYFWIIRKTNGTTDYPITDEYIQLEMQHINEFFAPMGICFVSQGTGFIDNDTIYPPLTSFGTVSAYAQNNNYVKANSLNVYIHPNIKDGNGVTNYGSNMIAIDSAFFRGVSPSQRHILAHEIAHTFGLAHVYGSHNGWTDSNGNGEIDPGEMIATEEHVTRDPLDPNYNALTKADKVADTPAMNSFWIEAKSQGLNIEDIIDQATCEYNGTAQDNLGVSFSLTPTDVGNPMGNTIGACVQGFTTGQGIRIREYIDGSPDKKSVQAMRTNNTSIILIAPETNTSFVHQYFDTVTTSTNYQVVSGQDIKLKAGDYIFLEPNTDIDSGSVFVAEIEKCDCEIISTFSSKKNLAEGFESPFEITTLKLYPNPNNGTFDIIVGKQISGNIDVEVYDISGKVIYRDSKQGAAFNISVPNLMSGMYIVRLSSGNYNETIKFVKN